MKKIEKKHKIFKFKLHAWLKQEAFCAVFYINRLFFLVKQLHLLSVLKNGLVGFSENFVDKGPCIQFAENTKVGASYNPKKEYSCSKCGHKYMYDHVKQHPRICPWCGKRINRDF